jgi:hypothetical protein
MVGAMLVGDISQLPQAVLQPSASASKLSLKQIVTASAFEYVSTKW